VVDRTQLSNAGQGRLVNEITNTLKCLYFKRNYVLAGVLIISMGVVGTSRKTHEIEEVPVKGSI